VSLPGALGHHRAAVRLDQLADDRETEAETAARMLHAAPLREAVEHVGQEVGADPLAGR
jgi:hypothetical protein